MSLGKELRWTILIQGFGALASFATVVLLGLMAGPAVQGEFSRQKSALDLLIAIAMLGAPQALLYFLRSGKISQRQVRYIILATGSLGAVCAAIYAQFYEKFTLSSLLLLVGATVAGTMLGVLRGAILATQASSIFNIITAMPQVLLLPVALVTLGHSTETNNASLPFFLTWVCSFGMALPFAKKIAPLQVNNPIRTSQLISFGGATWLTTVLMSGAPALWLQHIESTAGIVTTGHFAMGMIGVQVALTPINYAIPLLLKHWTNRNSPPVFIQSIGYGSAVTAVIISCIIISQQLHITRSESNYAPVYSAAGYFFAIAALESILKISYTASIANGQPWHPVLAEVARISYLGSAMAVSHMKTITDYASAWIGACIFSILISYFVNWFNQTNHEFKQ